MSALLLSSHTSFRTHFQGLGKPASFAPNTRGELKEAVDSCIPAKDRWGGGCDWERACTASVISGATAAVMYYSYAESQCSSGDRNIHDENNLPLFRFGLIADVQV